MAKAEPEQVDTPESIAEMEARVQAFRAKEAQEKATTQREAAKPLIDLVESDAFKEIEAAMPTLDALASDSAAFPSLRVHLDALRHGLFGVRQIVEFMPAPAAVAPANEQIVEG